MILRIWLGVVVGAVMLASSSLPASAETWGAVSCGLWRGSNGQAHAAVGAVPVKYATEDKAAAAADAACRKAGGRDCRTDRDMRFTKCGFISVGTSSNMVHCVSRGSAAEVMARCREAGYSCNTPIGYCAN